MPSGCWVAVREALANEDEPETDRSLKANQGRRFGGFGTDLAKGIF